MGIFARKSMETHNKTQAQKKKDEKKNGNNLGRANFTSGADAWAKLVQAQQAGDKSFKLVNRDPSQGPLKVDPNYNPILDNENYKNYSLDELHNAAVYFNSKGKNGKRLENLERKKNRKLNGVYQEGEDPIYMTDLEVHDILMQKWKERGEERRIERMNSDFDDDEEEEEEQAPDSQTTYLQEFIGKIKGGFRKLFGGNKKKKKKKKNPVAKAMEGDGLRRIFDPEEEREREEEERKRRERSEKRIQPYMEQRKQEKEQTERSMVGFHERGEDEMTAFQAAMADSNNYVRDAVQKYGKQFLKEDATEKNLNDIYQHTLEVLYGHCCGNEEYLNANATPSELYCVMTGRICRIMDEEQRDELVDDYLINTISKLRKQIMVENFYNGTE